MQRYDLINILINKFNYKNYLEIGVDAGITFRKVKCQNKTSVDPAKGHYGHAKPTHACTSDQFFKEIAPKLNEKFDIIFIDGLHEYKQVVRDIENSLKYLRNGGSIVLHDCNPLSENAQRYPRPESTYGKVWNGDVWKAVIDYRTRNKNCLVVDSDHGLGLINDIITSDLLVINDLKNISYQNFSDKRTHYLNLHSIKQIKEILE